MIVAVVGVVGTAVALGVYWSSRPETYTPGEDHDGITRRLSRGLPAEAPEPLFEDVTVDAGLGEFRSFAGDRTSQLPEDMGPGAAWGDYDNDGDEDLFLVSSGGPLTAPTGNLAGSQLYENLGDGRFALDESFPDTRIVGMGAAWADYDNDDDLDLVVTGYNTLRLFRNEDGHLARVEAFPSPAGFWAGASWSDFDRDGDLDLYVCGYVRYEPDVGGRDRISSQYGRSIPYTLNPSSYDPERNLLFVNGGNGTFEESAESLGVANPEGRSLVALWHDFDDDGWPDLYVANDISDNVLYLNREGRLHDASHAAWVSDYRGAMGLAAGDWNRDGDDDLFVTHWVAQENALYDSRWADDTQVRSADGAAQPLRFVDRADQLGLGQIGLRSVGWGTEFLDIDADSWLDLIVANGSTFEEQGEPRRLSPELPFLLWNEAGTFFHDLAPLSESWSRPTVSRGLATSDYDGDGDIDVLFVDSGGGVRLLRNDMQQGHRIQLRLLAPGPIEGTRILAHAGEVVHRRTVSGVSYLSQSSRLVHVGLGETDRVDRLEIRWPDGENQSIGPLAADEVWEVRKGGAEPIRITPTVPVTLSRQELKDFWRVQRAATRAMKVDGDLEAAAELFREALQLDPSHEDSIYYLGNCLAETGNLDGALAQFAELMRLNSASHRAYKRWGTLKAMASSSLGGMAAAEAALERAVEINPEATGARMVLAETSLVRGELETAEQRLRWILGTNPSAGDASFLLGYVAWKRGDGSAAREWLVRAGAAGEDWRPEGVAAEGDVERTMHRESTLLGRAYSRWNKTTEPQVVYAELDALVSRYFPNE